MKSTGSLEILQRLQKRPPAVGLTVLYGMDGIPRAAIIVGVDPFSIEGRVHLTVFPPGETSFPAQACYSEQLQNGFWTWPPGL